MIVFVLTLHNEIRFCEAEVIQDGLNSLGRYEKYGVISNALFEKAIEENLTICIQLTTYVPNKK